MVLDTRRKGSFIYWKCNELAPCQWNVDHVDHNVYAELIELAALSTTQSRIACENRATKLSPCEAEPNFFIFCCVWIFNWNPDIHHLKQIKLFHISHSLHLVTTQHFLFKSPVVSSATVERIVVDTRLGNWPCALAEDEDDHELGGAVAPTTTLVCRGQTVLKK